MVIEATGAAESVYNLIERKLGRFWAKALLMLFYATAVVVLLGVLVTGAEWLLLAPVASLAAAMRPTLERLDLSGVGLDVAAAAAAVAAIVLVLLATWRALRQFRLEQRIDAAIQRRILTRLGQAEDNFDGLVKVVDRLVDRVVAEHDKEPVRGFVVQTPD